MSAERGRGAGAQKELANFAATTESVKGNGDVEFKHDLWWHDQSAALTQWPSEMVTASVEVPPMPGFGHAAEVAPVLRFVLRTPPYLSIDASCVPTAASWRHL